MFLLQRFQDAGLINMIWITTAVAVTFALWNGSVSPVHGLPAKLDPIAVAVAEEISNSTSYTNIGLTADESTTTADVESAAITEVNTSHELLTLEQQESKNVSVSNSIPTYLLDLTDPDIGGPVDYVPSPDASALKVISWDLLPPFDKEPITETVSVDSKSTKSTNVYQPTSTFPYSSSTEKTTTPTRRQHYRGTVHYTSATSTPTVSKSTTSKTTKTATTTTKIVTPQPTTRTTPHITNPTTTTTTIKAPTTNAITMYTEPEDTSDFYQLEAGDSYTLPPWLADVDDPDLDVAVTFEVPADLKEYNQTIERDLQAPLEPFVDLKNVQVPEPLETKTKSGTTTTQRTTQSTTQRSTSKRIATSTPRSTTTTTKSRWITAASITTTSKPALSITNCSSASHIGQPPSHTQTSESGVHSNTSCGAQSQQQDHLPNFNQDLSTSTSDPISNSETQTVYHKPANPFLPAHNNGAYKPQPFIKVVHIDPTTTTTIKPIDLVKENPFDSNTIPAWLSDFDYPDVGPGVPFVYKPSASDTSPFSDLLPPNNIPDQETGYVKAAFNTTSSPSHGGSFSSPKSFTSQPKHTTFFPITVSPFIHTSDSPSNVSPSLPNINVNQNEPAVTLPPPVLIPPSIEEDTTTNAKKQVFNTDNRINANRNTDQKPFSSSSNHNFAAPFELFAQQETSPPFNAGSSVPTKISFSKSDNGKVVTNDIFLQATGAQPAARPSGFLSNFATTPHKGFQTSRTNQFFGSGSNSIQGGSTNVGTNNILNKSSTPPAYSGFSHEEQPTAFGPRDFTTVSTLGTGASGTHYTGNFGGAPGVLGHGHVGFAVRPDGSIRDPDHTFRPLTASQTAGTPPPVPSQPQQHGTPALDGFVNRAPAAALNANKYRGTFGGPPGILVPYDNVAAGRL